jgi:hypothetical protein
MRRAGFILLALRLHFPGGDAFKIDAIRGNCEVAPIGTKKILRQNLRAGEGEVNNFVLAITREVLRYSSLKQCPTLRV